MRLSETWLREYVNPDIDADQLVHQLTMAGLEVDSLEPAAAEFSGVVVARVLSTAPHPEADRLKVCEVLGVGTTPVQIVCGASNVRPGICVPLATEGACLPGGMKIKRSRLRGIESFGMLCSSRELGLEEAAEGLMELPLEAPVGASLRDYLALDDHILEVDLTPNRADCLSVEGIAREVAINNLLPLVALQFDDPVVHGTEQLDLTVEAIADCPRYLGRVINQVNPSAATPIWLKERLRRSGLRSLGILVDVTNYVLLELGQPLHAFDRNHIKGGIVVRHARLGETLTLLNEQTVTLDEQTLVIADSNEPLALAGIMGGAGSAVNSDTRDVFLECAFFAPALIMGKARRYGLATDSSHRFERGVDPELQYRALARATQLIIDHAGGIAGPLCENTSHPHLPVRPVIHLRHSQIARILGLTLSEDDISAMLVRLGMKHEVVSDGWHVKAPGFRFDIAIEADLIEEIGRIYGYDALPVRSPRVELSMQPCSELRLSLNRLKHALVDRGYQEAITYSFVDPNVQQHLQPGIDGLALKNPISSDLAVMRTSLWTGLLDAARKNLHRQQSRVRLFESGLCFIPGETGLQQTPRLAGLALGTVLPDQWAAKPSMVDFYDVKADISALLHLTGRLDFFWKAEPHPALHPGQSARLYAGEQPCGWLGMLHPSLEKQLDIDQRVYLFEVEMDILTERNMDRFSAVSRFPSVRRDLAFVVREGISVGELLSRVNLQGNGLIREVTLFDVYQGTGVPEGFKSVAFAVTLQENQETLTDAAVESVVDAIIADLELNYQARLRE